jgi:excisionase family DNA binding protein
VTTRARTAGRPRAWMGLGEAAEMLGVAPTTLRRWADDGLVSSFVTPGGHRRFSRGSIEALVPSEKRQRPSLDRLGGTPERMARAYRRGSGGPGSDATWVGSLDGAERDPLRERGRALASALLVYLDASPGPDRDARLDDAAAVAGEYGRVARAHGATIHQTVETYLRFSRPFVAEIATLARRRNLDTAEATELLETTLAALDRLLLATIAAHESAASGTLDLASSAAPAPASFTGRGWVDGGIR